MYACKHEWQSQDDMSYLRTTLRRAEDNGGQVGVLFLDVDNFKNINDSMGHAFGDRLLIAIATRLREATESRGFAARLGGDDFTVIYDEVHGSEDLNRVGGALVHAFHRPFLIENREILVGVSVGASLYPTDERDGQAPAARRRRALFEAKSGGRSQLSLFNPAMVEPASLKIPRWWSRRASSSACSRDCGAPWIEASSSSCSSPK
jgi:diguanylate cyclase (GGDEF)-like protein